MSSGVVSTASSSGRCSCSDGVYEVLERELRAFIVGEWAVLARLKPMMPIKVVLQRVLTAEDVLSFEQVQRGVADAIQILERSILK